jgi:hypothetical protein
MIFLSFGAGVQSSVLLMLAIRGEIEKPDHVIFADTGFEPAGVYEHAAWCEKQCQKAGLPFHRVQARRNMLEEFEAFESDDPGVKHWNSRPPLNVIDVGGRNSMKRQCTSKAKIKPLERKKLELLGHKTARGVADGAAVVQIGISTDEARRAAPSPTRWIDRDYPLIDPLKMSRADCQAWWERHYPHKRLTASSCVICPYKTPKMWAAMKRDQSEDFAKAVEYDERFRATYQRKTGQNVYVFRDFKPLAEANLNETQGTLDLDDEIYCAGGCGL